MKQEAENLYNYYRENLSYLVLAFGRNWRSWQFLIICTLSLILTNGGVFSLCTKVLSLKSMDISIMIWSLAGIVLGVIILLWVIKAPDKRLKEHHPEFFDDRKIKDKKEQHIKSIRNDRKMESYKREELYRYLCENGLNNKRDLSGLLKALKAKKTYIHTNIIIGLSVAAGTLAFCKEYIIQIFFSLLPTMNCFNKAVLLVVFCTLMSIVIYTITKMRRNMESAKWRLHDEIVIHLEDILEYDYRLIALK